MLIFALGFFGYSILLICTTSSTSSNILLSFGFFKGSQIARCAVTPVIMWTTVITIRTLVKRKMIHTALRFETLTVIKEENGNKRFYCTWFPVTFATYIIRNRAPDPLLQQSSPYPSGRFPQIPQRRPHVKHIKTVRRIPDIPRPR